MQDTMQTQRKLSTRTQLKCKVIRFTYQTKAMEKLIDFKVQGISDLKYYLLGQYREILKVYVCLFCFSLTIPFFNF